MSDTNTDSTVPDLYRLAFMPWAVPAARNATSLSQRAPVMT